MLSFNENCLLILLRGIEGRGDSIDEDCKALGTDKVRVAKSSQLEGDDFDKKELLSGHADKIGTESTFSTRLTGIYYHHRNRNNIIQRRKRDLIIILIIIMTLLLG